jgi:hypothetical protein
MHHQLLTLGVAVALLAGCTSSKTTTMTDAGANAAYDQKGWQQLFDGKEIKGWHTYGNTAPGKAWRVDDGAIHFDPAAKKSMGNKEGGDLVTDEAYENFHLALDWKVAPNANSGIIFLVQDDPKKYNATYLTGPEMQVLDNAGHPDAKIYKHKAGDLYDLIASSKEAQKPAGEWNHAEIVLNKGKLDFHLNGVNVVSTTMWDDNWNQLVAGSKFKGWSDFARNKSGHIALQDHGDPVWFKNIQIKRL